MKSIKASLAQLSEDLHLFGPQFSSEMSEIKRNVELRPVTGATVYRHCLEDLNNRVDTINENVEALESISVDALSLEDLVDHCVALYARNAKAIAALETHLQSFGYSKKYPSPPPENPLDLLHMSRTTGSATPTSPSLAAVTTSDPTAQTLQPPPTTSTFVQNTSKKNKFTAADAMAPMTAAKARIALRQDLTPSSMDSPDALTPSMMHLLGKYGSESSFSIDGLSIGSLSFVSSSSLPRSASRGKCMGLVSPLNLKMPRPSPMLSPAFAAAAEEHRKQLEETTTTTAATVATANNKEETDKNDSAKADSENLENRNLSLEEIAQADMLITSTAQKVATASDASFLDAMKTTYPHVTASIEKYSAARAHESPSSPEPTAGIWDEETTMELKNQVIFNRAANLASFQQQHTNTSNNTNTTNGAYSYYPSTSNTSVKPRVMIPTMTKSDSNRLEEAIAEALARPSYSTTTSTTMGVSSGGAAVESKMETIDVNHIVPLKSATVLESSSPFSPVPPFMAISEQEYASLPKYMRGQMGVPLDVINQAAFALHSIVCRRQAGHGGLEPSQVANWFTVVDVEELELIPTTQTKVFINTLTRLNRILIKCVYNLGTVYLFQ